MDIAYDSNFQNLLKRINRLRSGITQAKNNIEYGSFLSLPRIRSTKRLKTEVEVQSENELSKILFLGELVLLESKNLFEKLQEVESIIHENEESQIIQSFRKSESSLRRLEHLNVSRSSSEGFSLDNILSGYSENVGDFEDLAQKEGILALEKSQLLGVVPMKKGSLFKRFIAKVKRQPLFEKEISDTILVIGDGLRAKTGGLVRLPALYSMVKMAKPNLRLKIKDIEKAVLNMENKGIIPGLREVSGTKIVEMIPVTATPDQNTILELAAKTGILNIENILLDTKWTHERANRALKEMEEIGITKYDLTSREWSFPAFVKDKGE